MKHLDVEPHTDAVVLRPRDDLKGGEETEKLQRTFRERAGQGTESVVIDLVHTGFMNSLALGVLVSGHVTYVKRGGRFIICNADERVRKLLHVTELESVLEICDTLVEALAACAVHRAGESESRQGR